MHPAPPIHLRHTSNASHAPDASKAPYTPFAPNACIQRIRCIKCLRPAPPMHPMRSMHLTRSMHPLHAPYASKAQNACTQRAQCIQCMHPKASNASNTYTQCVQHAECIQHAQCTQRVQRAQCMHPVQPMRRMQVFNASSASDACTKPWPPEPSRRSSNIYNPSIRSNPSPSFDHSRHSNPHCARDRKLAHVSDIQSQRNLRVVVTCAQDRMTVTAQLATHRQLHTRSTDDHNANCDAPKIARVTE